MVLCGDTIAIDKDEGLRETNFLAFEKRYGCRPQIDKNESEKYRMTISRDGGFVLHIYNNGREILRMNSEYSPSYEADRWSQKEMGINRKTVIALLGFSTGVYLEALISRERPDTTFFVYEPEEALFAFVCAYIDITHIINNKNVRLYILEDQKNKMAQDLLWDMSIHRPETIGVITPFYGMDKRFENICESMRIFGSASRNYLKQRGRDALRCRLYAWNHLWESYTITDIHIKNVNSTPAVIVGAGPSLLTNVDVLRKIKGHAIIICTDRALSLLDEIGIEPDFVISIDAIKSAKYLETTKIKKLPILCDYQLNIDSQIMYRKRCIFYHALECEQALLGEKADNGIGFDHGGNVSGSAFTLCRLLGIKTIILVGQDMAYLDNKHHADGKEDGIPDTDIKEAEGVNGGTVKTCDMWINFRNFFERQIINYPELSVIDATEGGALIHGSTIMKLAEVADRITDNNFDINDVLNDMSFVQTKDQYFESLKVMEGWLGELDMIVKHSLKLKDLCHEMYKESICNNAFDEKNKRRVEEINKLRYEIYTTKICPVLENYWVEDMYSAPDRKIYYKTNEEAGEVYKEAELYYSQLAEDSESLKKEMIQSMETGKKDATYAG